MTNTLKCYCGRDIIHDPEDTEKLTRFTYYCVRDSAVRTSQSPQVNIARLLIDVPEYFEPDHINRDGHDNRKANLRIATPAENMCNRRRSKANTTGYIGVMFNKLAGRYRAYIYKDRRNIHLGYFSTAEEAAKARDEKAKELHGEFASLNFKS